MTLFGKNKEPKETYYDDGVNMAEFEDEETGDYEDYAEEPAPEVQRPARRQTYSAAPKADNATGSRPLDMNTEAKTQVVVRTPEVREDGFEIADHLLRGHTVMINLESINKETGEKILDFLGGVTYATHGALTRVTKTTFIVTPYNVGVIRQNFLSETEDNDAFYG